LLFNTEKEAVDLILKIMQDKNLQEKMKKEQKKTLKRFDANKMARKYERIYFKINRNIQKWKK